MTNSFRFTLEVARSGEINSLSAMDAALADLNRQLRRGSEEE